MVLGVELLHITDDVDPLIIVLLKTVVLLQITDILVLLMLKIPLLIVITLK